MSNQRGVFYHTRGITIALRGVERDLQVSRTLAQPPTRIRILPRVLPTAARRDA